MVRHEYIGLTTSALYNTPLPVRLPVADLGILESVCVCVGGGCVCVCVCVCVWGQGPKKGRSLGMFKSDKQKTGGGGV